MINFSRWSQFLFWKTFDVLWSGRGLCPLLQRGLICFKISESQIIHRRSQCWQVLKTALLPGRSVKNEALHMRHFVWALSVAVESHAVSAGVVFLCYPGMRMREGTGSCSWVRLSKIQLHPLYPRRVPLALACQLARIKLLVSLFLWTKVAPFGHARPFQ